MSTEVSAVDQVPLEATVPITRSPPAPLPDPEERSPAQILWTLLQARGLISLVTVAFVALGAVYLAVTTPVYRSDVVVQVEENQRSIAGLSELSSLLSEREPADTEMEILRSRSLLSAVVDELRLDVVAQPVRFPLLGYVGGHYRGAEPRRAFLGLESYAWGGERLSVERLDVSDDLVNQPLTLVARDGGKYDVRGPHQALLLTGKVGKAAAGAAGGERVEMFVSDLLARPGTRFSLVKRARNRVVQELQERLRINEKVKKTGVIVVALDSTDPRRAAAILDAVAATYVRQNVERRSAEAAKTLEFLESQLPTLKANLDAAEAALKGYQVEKGTLDLSREAQAMLSRSVEIEKAVSEAELQRSDLRQRFTENHPALLSLTDKIAKLRAEEASMNAKMRALPGTELESARLTRDVKVAGELYNVLLNKAQELRVVKSGTIGNVRILDRASAPDEPIRPKSGAVLILSLLTGLLAGVALAFTRRSLYTGVDDPDMVESLTGVAVYATIPKSAKQASLAHRGQSRLPLLAAIDPADVAVEAVRSLRTGLQFAMLEAKNNVIVVTGPTAEVGKSFVTVNLAHVMAAAGSRVLLLDCDLRRGRVHRFFGAERTPGLSDVLSGNATLAEAIRKSALEGLHWISTGKIPPNPSELIGSERFARLLADMSARFDVVLVDTAPILPVTDAALIGRYAGTTLLVLRAAAHPIREIAAAVRRLALNGVRVQGAVFNDVAGAGARYSRYGYQYRYDSRD